MYLTYQHYSTASKNKLEEEFYNYLKSIDRTLIEDNEIEDFKAEILQKYDDLCKEFPRCKPIKKSLSKMFSEDIILFGSNAEFKLLKSK